MVELNNTVFFLVFFTFDKINYFRPPDYPPSQPLLQQPLFIYPPNIPMASQYVEKVIFLSNINRYNSIGFNISVQCILKVKIPGNSTEIFIQAHLTRTAQNVMFPSSSMNLASSSQEFLTEETTNRDNHFLQQFHHDQHMLAQHYR